MDKNLNDIENIFYTSLKDLSENPSSAVWQRLNEDLEAEKNLKKKNKPSWTKKAGACMLFLSLSQPLFHPVKIAERSLIIQSDHASTNSPFKSIELKSKNNFPYKSFNTTGISETLSLTEKKYQEENIIGKDLQLKISDWQPAPAGRREFIFQRLKEKPNIYIEQQSSQLIPMKPMAGKGFVPFWTYTFFVSGDFNRYHLENDVLENINGQVPDFKNELAGREKPELSFTSGLMAAYRFNKHFALQTGLMFSIAEISIDPHEIHAVQDEQTNISYKLNLSSGYAYFKPGFAPDPTLGDSIKTDGSHHVLRFFSVPVNFQYIKQYGKFSLMPAFGVSGNYIAGAKLTTDIIQSPYDEKEETTKIHGLRKFYFGIQANAGIRYSFNKKLAVDIIPSFRYAITPITKNTVVSTHPYSFGMGVGISKSF